MKKLFYVLFIMILLNSCTYQIAEFSLVSTGTPQYANMANVPTEKSIEGSDGRLSFLFVPIGGRPSLKEAVNKCLDEGNGDFVERARFYGTYWNFILFSYEGFSVIGDVGNSRYNVGTKD